MGPISGFDPNEHEFDRLLAEIGGLVAEVRHGIVPGGRQRENRGDGLVDDLLSERPGAGPGDLGAVLDRLRQVLAVGVDNTSPGELAYIPGSGLLTSALGDFVAGVANRYTGLAALNPAAVALEQSVLSWLTEQFGFPSGSQAVLLSGGSAANLTAVVAARERSAGTRPGLATLYVGEHAHASVRKAARIAGIPAEQVRICATGDGTRLDPEAVHVAVKQDLADGFVPTAIVAAAGTTNSGAVDPLSELADLARRTGVWFHVDAAYGGFFQLTERGRRRLAGIERADSVTLDPHKSLFLPFGTGALLVRDRDDLTRAFAEDADYLRDQVAGPDRLPDFGSLTPELTRSWRGLRLWLPLQIHGVDAFREALDRALDLADHAQVGLGSDPNVEVVGRPDLSIVTFRVAGDDAAQDRLLAAVNADGRVHLSSTVVEGRVVIRLAVLSHRTTRETVDLALERVRRLAAEQVQGSWPT